MTTEPKHTAARESEREAFEAWARDRYQCSDYSFVRSPDGYAHSVSHKALNTTYASVQMLWEAWQARAAAVHSAAAAQPVAGWRWLPDTTHDERSWPEDYSHENGSYYNTCVHCLRTFVGHKRRPVCRVCAATPPAAQPTVTDEMVTRFLGWSLPKDFCPDCGISFDGRKDDEWNKNKTWPVGTNLLTAIQARQMLEHALGVQP